MPRKPSRGRQRIKLEKMKNKNNLQVTFSKRRSSVMKKCNELTTRTGAEMAVLVFSPGNKVYSWGNPSVESVLNRFQNVQNPDTPQPPNNNNSLTEMLHRIHRERTLNDLFERADRLREELEAERRCKQLMDQMSGIEAEGSLENLSLEELEKMRDTFQELNQMVLNKAAGNFNHFPNATRDMPTIGNNYVVSGDAFGVSSQVYEAGGPSTFGVGGSHFNHGESSSSIYYGVPMTAPTTGKSVETSTFGGFGFHSIPGGGSSGSINTGVQGNVPPPEVAPPSVDSFVEPHYAPMVEDDDFHPSQ